MWIAWGEYYASIPQDEREIAAPASAVIAALLALASSSMSGWVGMAFAMSMPVISGTCLIWATKEAPLVDAGNSSASRERNADGHALSIRQSIASMGRTLPGIFVACVFVCIAGGFADHAGGAEISAQPVMLAALVFTIALAGAAIMGPRRISIPFFYRWMCPALVAGFGATVVFPGAFGAGVALTTSIAARFSFCLITQMFFARLADSGKITATQAFGWGWIAVHLGDFVGIVILIALSHPLETGALTLDAVAVASIIVLVTATMFVLDDTKSFGGFMDRAAAGGKNGDVAAKTPDSAEEGASILREERTDGHDAAGPTARNADESSERKADTAKEPDVEADGITRAASIGGDNACSTQKTEARTFDEVVASIARASRLTPRETQVFGLLARGRSIPYIRDELVISRETAATHAKHIYAKLDVHSRQELIDLVAREI